MDRQTKESSEGVLYCSVIGSNNSSSTLQGIIWYNVNIGKWIKKKEKKSSGYAKTETETEESDKNADGLINFSQQNAQFKVDMRNMDVWKEE